MLATPNVDRVRNRFLERTGGSASEEEMSPYLEDDLSKWSWVYDVNDSRRIFLDYFTQHDLSERLYRYERDEAYWERIEYMAGLCRLGVSIYALFTESATKAHWDPDSDWSPSNTRYPYTFCIDSVFKNYRSLGADALDPSALQEYLAKKSPFLKSMCVQRGLERKTPFPWPVIEMAEFERSQQNSTQWHRKVLIVLGLKQNHLAEYESSDDLPVFKSFCADILFSQLKLCVTHVSVTVNAVGLRDCVFIVFGSEREAEIAQNAIDEIRLINRTLSPPLDGGTSGIPVFDRIRARLFHHYNRNGDDEYRKRTNESEDEDKQRSSNESSPKAMPRRQQREGRRKGKPSKKVAAAGGGDDEILLQEEERKTKASRSVRVLAAQKAPASAELLQGTTATREYNERELLFMQTQVAESTALLEELRYKLSATELVNERLRHSARDRQEELQTEVISLQRQLQRSVGTEREMATRYNTLLTDRHRMEMEMEECRRRLRNSASGMESEQLMRSLMRRDVSHWVDEAVESNGDADALLGKFEQDLKMVLAKISIAREEIQKSQAETSGGGNNMCLLCMENVKTHLLLPCRHLVYCQSCFNRASQSAYDPYTNPHGETRGIESCPVCRSPVQDHMHVFN